MSTVSAKAARRLAGLLSTVKCIENLAELSSGATPDLMSRTLAVTRLEMLEANWVRFQREHEALLDMNVEGLEEHFYFKDSVESRCQRKYEEAKVALLSVKEHFDRVEPTGATLADVSAIASMSSLRRTLPEIQLPNFKGDFNSWRSFHDLFVSMIGQNHELTSVEKMHYLRTSLGGEAAQLISNLPVSSDSFAAAWDMLVDRYENKRRLISSHLDRLFGLPVTTPRSAKSLNALINTVTEVLNALRALEVPIKHWDILLVHFIVSRLDVHLREQWELKLGASKEPPPFAQLREFLVARARAFESVEGGQRTTSQPASDARLSTSKSPRPKPATVSHVTSQGASTSAEADRRERDTRKTRALAATEPLRPTGTAVESCHYCLDGHFVANCPLFKKRSPRERRVIAQQRLLCFNCLGPHSAVNCRVTKRCLECGGKHHTLIHVESPSSAAPKPKEATAPTATSSPKEPTTTSTESSSPVLQVSSLESDQAPVISGLRPLVVLATSQALLSTSTGASLQVRLLIDPGSELSFISERVVQLTRPPRVAGSIDLRGIGGLAAGRTRGAVTVTLSSIHDQSSRVTVSAFILKTLTSALPSFSSNREWAHLKGLPLADPDFLSSRPVDVLIGADTYGLIIEGDVIKGRPTEPIAQRRLLGWIVLGPVSSSTRDTALVQHASTDDDLTVLLKRFWEQEEIPSDSASTPDPDAFACEQHFSQTHSRDASGRYIVRLPFKGSTETLGDSFMAARRCLASLLRRLDSNSNYRSLYEEFLREYEALSHMEKVSSALAPSRAYYLPHHGVFRAHSSTTKLRVVFNGSCKTSSGASLNDLLHSGPKLQQDTSDVLLWIRRHRFIFATDIAKMFRQITLHSDDRDLQRILWVDSTGTIVPYQLTTVTYGLSCAPFLAIRVMLQLVEDEGRNFPLAVLPLTKGRYVDDIFGGADDEDELQAIASQLQEICKRGCFPLQKWASNSQTVLQVVDVSSDRPDAVVIQTEDASVKLLGLVWNSSCDNFGFTLQPSSRRPLSKRIILSETAQLFDPLGFISPVIVVAKILLQELWLIKLHWDDELPSVVQNRWLRFRENLADLSAIALPRFLHFSSKSQVELHGFSDASQMAMSAVVYLRATNPDGTTTVTLVCSKTKVAPLKRLTIPRLELTAALLLSRLCSYVQRTLEFSDAPVHLWTDSSVSLAWITSLPSRWKEFVRNRVTAIQELTSHAHWHFISGKENPADCASRGLTPLQLSKTSLWWNGPVWLSHPQETWPTSTADTETDCDLEQRPGLTFVSSSGSVQPVWDLVDRYSSLNRLLRVTALCQRAVARFQRVPHASMTTQLTPGDLEHSKLHWIRLIQAAHFAVEIRLITSGALLPRNNPLAALTPFVDQHGTLRVGGRLNFSNLNTEEKHPPVLPRASRFTFLVIADAHLKTLHGGTQATLSYLRTSYWILGGRAPIRSFILRCTICARHRGLRAQQLMGQLPSPRVNPSRPFLHTGVDYAGPFTLKARRGRGAKTYKGYLVVFVCFSSSAVHLELATDYSTDGFLAAYRRFSGRRGVCHTLYSDCGTNFVGADKELRALFRDESAEITSLVSSLTNFGTRWSFNPPAAPHMGGKWEAAVKSAKHHLRRVLGDTVLTYEEFTTLLTQIEAVLNSRPLCPLSDDPEDDSVLTPAHFLIGQALTTVPEPSLLLTAEPRLSRWQLIQSKLQHFWKRWSSEYLQRSLAISKWQHPSYNIKEGSIVLLTDERFPPSRWLLARVLALHPGADGLARVVTLRTASSTFKRPISRLCVLPVDSSPT